MNAAEQDDPDRALSREAASAAVDHLGWRLLLSSVRASVPVTSTGQALTVAATAVQACGGDADLHLHVDLRADRVELTLQNRALGAVTVRDAELAAAVGDAVADLGLRLAEPMGGRPVQALEIAIDAMDIPSIVPFWRAVMAYGDEPGMTPGSSLADPAGQGPTIWFQQMDEPRPQRNRIHFDITVARDEAEPRIAAALDAGGVLVSDTEARAFWILADAEGNEICVCTYQDRD